MRTLNAPWNVNWIFRSHKCYTRLYSEFSMCRPPCSVLSSISYQQGISKNQGCRSHVPSFLPFSSPFSLSSGPPAFFRQLPAELAERNSNIFGHMVGRKCSFKMHVQNLGYPTPYKPGVQKPPFSTISQLNGKFNGIYLPNETWYRQSGKCVDNYEGSATSSQNDMNFGPQMASTWKWVFTHPS